MKSTDVVDPCDFDNGWHAFNTSCFKYSVIKRSWLDAQQQCVDGNGQLAVLNTRDKWSMTQEFLPCQDFGAGIWIGLSDTVSRQIKKAKIQGKHYERLSWPIEKVFQYGKQ